MIGGNKGNGNDEQERRRREEKHRELERDWQQRLRESQRLADRIRECDRRVA